MPDEDLDKPGRNIVCLKSMNADEKKINNCAINTYLHSKQEKNWENMNFCIQLKYFYFFSHFSPNN